MEGEEGSDRDKRRGREGRGGEERVEGARERHTEREGYKETDTAETVISIKHRNTTERPTDTGEQRQTDRPWTDAFETAYIH